MGGSSCIREQSHCTRGSSLLIRLEVFTEMKGARSTDVVL
jgi:hypothetical protein